VLFGVFELILVVNEVCRKPKFFCDRRTHRVEKEKSKIETFH